MLPAAVKEFGMRNVQEANLPNIVADAGISRGSLYRYFPNKENMYIHVFETLRARRAAYVHPAYALYKKAPFIQFFEAFYLRDSEFLLQNPSHVELGKQLYSHSHGVSCKLIQQIQTRYKEAFLVAIEFDKEHSLIDRRVDSSTLADLCVHFVTDIFIFQSVLNQLSISIIREHAKQTLYIVQNGIAPREDGPTG